MFFSLIFNYLNKKYNKENFLNIQTKFLLKLILFTPKKV